MWIESSETQADRARDNDFNVIGRLQWIFSSFNLNDLMNLLKKSLLYWFTVPTTKMYHNKTRNRAYNALVWLNTHQFVSVCLCLCVCEHECMSENACVYVYALAFVRERMNRECIHEGTDEMRFCCQIMRIIERNVCVKVFVRSECIRGYCHRIVYLLLLLLATICQ